LEGAAIKKVNKQAEPTKNLFNRFAKAMPQPFLLLTIEYLFDAATFFEFYS
jgi:hypothetical protein